MPTNTCRHIKEDGVYCQNLPLQGRNYCYAHLLARGRQMRMAREALRQRLRPLFLPPLDDLNAVRNAISLLMAAHAAERIGERSLGLMLWGLQQAASILKFQACMPAAAGVADQAQERVEAYPGFEREFGLPEDFDLSQPPEVAFPPEEAELASETAALEAAVPGQDAVQLASACCPEPGLVTPEDMELEEIQATKDYATWKKRFDEVQVRRARERRKVDEARWLIQATQRNYDVIHRPPKVREDWEKVLAEDQARERAHSGTQAEVHSEAGRKPPQTVAAEAPLPKAVGQGRQKRTKGSRAVPRAEARS